MIRWLFSRCIYKMMKHQISLVQLLYFKKTNDYLIIDILSSVGNQLSFFFISKANFSTELHCLCVLCNHKFIHIQLISNLSLKYAIKKACNKLILSMCAKQPVTISLSIAHLMLICKKSTLVIVFNCKIIIDLSYCILLCLVLMFV